jgi:nucleoside-diphosphate-sugar epimerase
MKALIIGGTGTISTAVTALLAKRGAELTLLNRGTRSPEIPGGVEVITCDINDEARVKSLLEGRSFDVVADFIAFRPEHVERDIRLFTGKTSQYIYISSASVYKKPLTRYPITESMPVGNPFWKYAQDKIACEERLTAEYRRNGFPITIIRPSHTYGDRKIPVAVHGGTGESWPVLARIRDGKPIIVHGDGLSLWTFMHNTDFAKAFCGIMDNPHAIGETVQITGDEILTWNDAYRVIGKLVGKEPKLVHVSSTTLEKEGEWLAGSLTGDKANSLVFDNTKLKQLVPGFRQKLRYDQGAARVLANILAHPELQTADPDFDVWCDRIATKYSL